MENQKNVDLVGVQLKKSQWESVVSAIRMVAQEEYVLSFLEGIANQIELQVCNR